MKCTIAGVHACTIALVLECSVSVAIAHERVAFDQVIHRERGIRFDLQTQKHCINRIAEISSQTCAHCAFQEASSKLENFLHLQTQLRTSFDANKTRVQVIGAWWRGPEQVLTTQTLVHAKCCTQTGVVPCQEHGS